MLSQLKLVILSSYVCSVGVDIKFYFALNLQAKFHSFLKIIFFITFIYFVCVHVCHRVHRLRSEDNLWQSVLSFHHVCPGNRTQIMRVGGKCLYQMSHLGAPEFPFLGKQKPKQNKK